MEVPEISISDEQRGFSDEQSCPVKEETPCKKAKILIMGEFCIKGLTASSERCITTGKAPEAEVLWLKAQGGQSTKPVLYLNPRSLGPKSTPDRENCPGTALKSWDQSQR